MRVMKDSGIEYIGLVPSNWSILKTIYVLDMPITDGPHTTPELLDSGIPFISAEAISTGKIDFNHMRGYVSEDFYRICCLKYIPRKNDIYMVKSGATTGRVAMVEIDETFTIWSPLAVFRANENKVLSRFLFYSIQSPSYTRQVEHGWSFGTQQNIGMRVLERLKICLPTIEEQFSIVDFLDAKCAEIDALTTDIQTQIDTLEQYKRSVITETVTKGLNPDAEMKDSGIQWIGDMPAHWDVIRGKYILRYMQKPVREDDGVITCFRDGEVTLRSNRREDGFTMSDKEIGYQGIDVGDLVVHGMDGFAGSIGISDSRGKASPVLNVLDTDQCKRYIMYYLRSMAYSDVFLALATGIRVRSCDLRWNKLAELSYPVPPLDEQNAIVKHIDSVLSKADAVIADKKAQLATLDEYKKSLIFEYVTGKKEVPVS